MFVCLSGIVSRWVDTYLLGQLGKEVGALASAPGEKGAPVASRGEADMDRIRGPCLWEGGTYLHIAQPGGASGA